MERLLIQAWDSELVILIHEALHFSLEGINRSGIPPVSEVPGFIIMTTTGVKGYGTKQSFNNFAGRQERLTMRELMATDRSKSAIREVMRYPRVVENRALHYTRWEDDFISRGIVICLLVCHVSPVGRASEVAKLARGEGGKMSSVVFIQSRN